MWTFQIRALVQPQFFPLHHVHRLKAQKLGMKASLAGWAGSLAWKHNHAENADAAEFAEPASREGGS